MTTAVSEDSDSVWWTGSAMPNTTDTGNWTVTKKPHDHICPMNSLSGDEDYRMAENIIECGFLPVLGLLGLPANILNMVVFYRQGLRDKMNLCLFTLAFVDFMFLLTMCVSSIFCPAVFLSDSLLEQILKWNTRKFTVNFQYSFWYSSGILTAIIATERCICVVWPMKSANICQTRTLACIIFGAFIAINLLCLPYALKHKIIWGTDKTGESIVVFADSDLYISNKLTFQIIRDTILPSISFVTFFVVSFVTVVTVTRLKTAMDWRQKTSSNVMDKRQVTLVKILITVSCVYITCNAPKLSLAIVRFLVDGFSNSGKYSSLFFITHRAGYVPLMVNSSVNIFIYYKQSSRFQKELRSMCSLCGEDQSKTNQPVKASGVPA